MQLFPLVIPRCYYFLDRIALLPYTLLDPPREVDEPLLICLQCWKFLICRQNNLINGCYCVGGIIILYKGLSRTPYILPAISLLQIMT